MQLKLQVPSLELHVPGPQDQAGWRSGPWDTLGHAAWLFLPASCHGMLRVTAGPPSGRHRKARPPCRLSGVCSLAVHSRIPASVYLRSCPCLIAGVPVFTSLDLSKDRLLLSFGAHSEQQVANTAGRSPRSPPRPLPWRRSELCDWRARKSDLGRLHPSPPGSLSEPAPRQRGFCGCHPRSMRGAHGPCR